MLLTEKKDRKFWSDAFEEHNWLRFVTYGTVAVIGIWVLGKAAKLMTDAVVNRLTVVNQI